MPVLQPEKTKPQKKPQARGFHPDAMAQAQALNQQPDSIPAMMKPGEYVLPPDTVAAMGGPGALDATVAQTHTPANAGAMVPQGFEPRLFFSSGGLAQDEEQNPKPISPTNIYPQGSPSAGANIYGGAIDAAKSAVSAAANPQGGQPLVKGAAQMFGQRAELQQQGRERWDASVAARQPAPAQPAQPVGLPAAAAAPSTAPAVTSGFASAQDGMTNDFGRQPSSPTPMAAAAPSTAQKTPASDPQSRINEQMANAQRQRAEGIAAVQRGQAYDSTARQQLGPQSTADTGPTSFTGDVLRTAGQDAQAAWQRGGAEGVGAAAGALVRGSMATPGAIAYDAVDSVVNGPIGQGIGGFTRGLFGGAGQPPPPAAPTTTARQSTAGGASAAPERTLEQLGKQLGGLDRQHAQNVQLQAAARTPEQARAEVQQTEGLAQLRGLPGVYQHGKGQYSDNPEGMGFATGFTGQPSAQNMQAANALASQQQAQSTARVQAAQQQAVPQTRGFPGFEMPRQENAYERENRMRERNRIMGMLQTPMTGDPRRDLTSSQRQQLVGQLGEESRERQATERNMFGLAGQQLNAESQRYSTDASTAVGADRNTIDQQRVGMEATTKGFDVRQAQRKQSFQEAWAKGTKEQREQLQQMYPDLFGNEDKKKPYSFDVVRGSVDPMTGKREGDYAVVVDPNTGQYRQVQIGGGAAVPTAAPQEASKSVL